MFMFCLTWLTCSSNTNMFVVDRKQFSEITNAREHWSLLTHKVLLATEHSLRQHLGCGTVCHLT